MNHVFGELGIRFWVISSIQAFLLVRLTEVWRKSKQKEKKKRKKKSWNPETVCLGFTWILQKQVLPLLTCSWEIIFSVHSGVVQRAAVSVREAGRGDPWLEGSEAAMHGRLRDNPLCRAAPFPLPEALPGVRPPATGQRHGAAGHYGPVLQTPQRRQSLRLASRL